MLYLDVTYPIKAESDIGTIRITLGKTIGIAYYLLKPASDSLVLSRKLPPDALLRKTAISSGSIIIRSAKVLPECCKDILSVFEALSWAGNLIRK